MSVIDEVKILVKAEVQEAIKNLDKTEKSSNDLRKSFKDLRDIMQGPVAAAKEVASALSGVVNVTVGLYKEFGEAELAAIKLNAAISNSDNLSNGASERLSSFADELQSFSIFEGDATKSIIANLAAMGKSESQIKDLVTAASNLASATGVSLDTAVAQLNGTLSGNVGLLGRQNSAIKNLTDEQLKNGDAIKIINEQYAGFAEKVGKSAIGSLTQLENNFGDLKETVGELIGLSFKPFVEGLSQSVKSANDLIIAFNSRDKLRKNEKLTLDEVLTLESQLKDEIKQGNSQYNIRGTMAAKDLENLLKIKGGLQTEAILNENALKLKQEEIKKQEELEKKKQDALKKAAELLKKEKEEEEEFQNTYNDRVTLIKNNRQFLKEEKKEKEEIYEVSKDENEITDNTSGIVKSVLGALKEKLNTERQSKLENEKIKDESKKINDEVEKWAEAADGVDYILRNISTSIYGNTKAAQSMGKALSSAWEMGIDVANEYERFVNNQRDLEMKKNEQKNDAYIKGLEDEVAKYADGTDEKYTAEKKLKDENARIAKEEKDLKNKYGREAFEAKKAISVAEITINGAIAAIKAWTDTPTAAAPFVSAAIAGLAAAQIGLVSSQQYVPMAQGGIVTSPTRALIGEAGAEAVIPLRGGNMNLGKNVTIVQNIGGSVVTEKYLTKQAIKAIESSERGY